MALERAVVGARSHAELVDLVVRQSVLLDELRATVAGQQALIARLEARIRELEAERDAGGGPQGMPGLKPQRAARGPKRPRKKRAHNFARRRAAPGAVTARVVHAVERCPHCATPLSGGWVKWTREVLEVPQVPAQVIEHVYLERRCPRCRARVVPPAEASGMGRGRQRLGVGLTSLIAGMRAEGRLPLATIQWYLQVWHGLELSVGALVGALHRVAARGEGPAERVLARVRASPVVHADETGWREAGTNGYVWTFSTPTERYFVRGGRNKGVVDAVLGPDFQGVLCTDFYAAYDHYDGPHQRCWTHLLRDLHELVQRHPRDAVLREWATQVHGVYDRARRFRSAVAAERLAAQQALETELLALCAPALAAGRGSAPHFTLCARVQKYLPELFTFVAQPAVPADNNAAERSLRHLVTQRKISGGTQSAAGSSTLLTLATLFGTWRARGLDPLIACRHLLATSQP